MNVLRLYGKHALRLHDEPIPESFQDHVLLKVEAIGICGSDLHWYEDGHIGSARVDTSLILGHEFGASVAEGPHKGLRVAVDPADPCLRCEYCLQGNPNLCLNHRFAGSGSTSGSMREYMTWPKRLLHPIPDELSMADAAMLEPLGIVIHAVDLAHVKTGMSAAVLGCGPIGLLTIQVAKAAGVTHIVATDRLPHRLEMAQIYGADEIILANDNRDEAQAILELGKEVDIAFEGAGDNLAVETAVDITRPGGVVILSGIPSDDRTSFNASTARNKGLTIKLVRRMKHVYDRAINLVECGIVDVRTMVTHTYPLTDYQMAFSIAEKREGVKIILEP